MIRFIYLFFTLITFSTCTTELNLDDVFEEKTIIEGYIMKNEKARVRVSKSVSKTSQNNFPIIDNAIITLTDSINSEQLSYLGNGVYESKQIIGTPNRMYEIEVSIEDEIYTAKTKMPEQTIWIDSIGFKQEINFDTTNYIDLLEVFAFPSDELITKDYGFFTLRIDGNLAFDARVFFQENPTEECPYRWEVLNINEGSNLEVELIQLESNLYDYFLEVNKLNDQINFLGLSVAPPANIKGNFDKDILGYFGALNTDKKRRILGE